MKLFGKLFGHGKKRESNADNYYQPIPEHGKISEEKKYFHASSEQNQIKRPIYFNYICYGLCILFGLFKLVEGCSDYFSRHEAYYKEKYSGVIDELTFSEKKTPIVTIQGTKHYLLTTNSAFDQHIEVGDSLIKTVNSWNFELIKKVSKEHYLSEISDNDAVP